MSFLGVDLRDVGAGLASRVTAGVAALRRVTPAVALLRLIVAVSMLAGSALALPWSTTTSRAFVFFAALAVVAALGPRTLFVSVAALAIAGAWALVDQERPLWRVLALAMALYVAHASAALAAALPHDCAVAPSALRGWAARTGGVVLASLVIGGVGLVVTGEVSLPSTAIGAIVGSLLAAVIAGVLAWQLHRRR